MVRPGMYSLALILLWVTELASIVKGCPINKKKSNNNTGFRRVFKCLIFFHNLLELRHVVYYDITILLVFIS